MIQNTLKTSVQLSEESAEQNITRFSQQLKDDVPKLHEQIDETRQTLMNTTIESPEADVEEVTAFLIGCKEAAHHEVELAERFARYQLALGMPITDYEDFDDVKGDMQLKLKLWEHYNSWNRKVSPELYRIYRYRHRSYYLNAWEQLIV